MKKTTTTPRFFTTLMLLVLCTLSWADGTKINGIYYVLDSNTKTATVTYAGTGRNGDYNKFSILYSASITIPSTITYNLTTYSVTSIGTYAFEGCTALTSITIPNSVTSIGSYAFEGCTALTSITIPNSVTSIGSHAFERCTDLTSITIPNSVTSIGGSTFYSCRGLMSITIGNSVTNIGASAFYGCLGLTKAEFASIESLCSIQFSIDSNPLQYAHHLYINGQEVTDVVIPNSVTSIGNYVFCGCKSLTSVTIPRSVTSIGDYAFRYCGFTSVTIPSSVKSIGSYAFNACELTSVSIPNSVKSIGKCAFYGNSSLKEVYCLAEQIPTAESNTFDDISHIASATLYVPESALDDYKTTAPWSGFGTFKALGFDFETDGIFYNINSSETSVSVTYKTTDYNCYSGSVFIPATVTYNSKEYSVTSIGSYAFSGCSGLTSVIIPESVTSIGDNTFSSCTDLKDVTLPNSVKSIGNDAFPSTTKIYVKEGISPLIAAWRSGINPYDLSTNTCLISPNNYRVSSYASSIRLIDSTPTNLIKIDNESLTINGVTASGKTVSITGLTPNTSYQVQYSANITYGDGTSVYTREDSKSTEALTFTTSQPKVISVGNAVVGATSNLDDAEENVGFEWRRTDWTSDFASNTGAAYLYEGTMEGYIRNLYTEKLWKVRPYYKDNNGTSYYGEWVGLDPTNTSYYEPTVHTYAKIGQAEDKVRISGYVQRGTDAVSKQGFKYWVQEDNARGAGISVPSSAKTVEAEGRVMEVELTGLLPNTTYSYVAFVTTTEGETFYGKQLSFTTGEDPDATLVGDANGNGVVEIGDVTSVLTLMATPEATGYDTKAADANKNGVIEIGDVTTILTIMAGGE